jgi:hypothetical protein
MITLSQLTELLGWALVINLCIYFLGIFFLTTLKGFYLSIHSKVFGVSKEDLSREYFRFIGQYKMLVLIFNLAPYIALKIMGQ